MTGDEDTTQQTLLRKGGKRRRNFDHLFSTLPRTANAIDSNSMVADLPDTAKEQIKAYILNRSPGSAEIVDALFWIATNYPKQLRTKELVETIESVTLIGAKLNHLLASSANADRKKNMTVYDLACGHGLVGILLAYRFPDINVICIDKERRSCWSTYIEAFERYGEKSKDNDTVMSNLEFREGDIMNKFTPTLSPNTSCFQPKIGDYLVCIHGCNDLSPFIIQTAIDYNCGYAVMPCCLRENMLGVSTSSSNNNWGMDDTTRYSLQVGYLAGKYGCEKIVSISKYITNRYLIIIGDWYDKKIENEEIDLMNR